MLFLSSPAGVQNLVVKACYQRDQRTLSTHKPAEQGNPVRRPMKDMGNGQDLAQIQKHVIDRFEEEDKKKTRLPFGSKDSSPKGNY